MLCAAAARTCMPPLWRGHCCRFRAWLALQSWVCHMTVWGSRFVACTVVEQALKCGHGSSRVSRLMLLSSIFLISTCLFWGPDILLTVMQPSLVPFRVDTVIGKMIYRHAKVCIDNVFDVVWQWCAGLCDRGSACKCGMERRGSAAIGRLQG